MVVSGLLAAQGYAAYLVWSQGGFENQARPLGLWVASSLLLIIRLSLVAAVVKSPKLEFAQMTGEHTGWHIPQRLSLVYQAAALLSLLYVGVFSPALNHSESKILCNSN